MANLIQINGKKLKDSNAASMASLAPVESNATASMAHAVGDYFWLNDTLYEATTSISIGNEISVGTNCKISKLAENITDLKSQLDDYVIRTVIAEESNIIIGKYIDTNGVPQTSSNFNCTNYINIRGTGGINISAHCSAFALYNENHEKIAYYANSSTVLWANVKGFAPSGTTYIRMSAPSSGYTDHNDFYVNCAYFTDVNMLDGFSTQESVDILNDIVGDPEYTNLIDVTKIKDAKVINASTGKAQDNLNGWSISDFLPLKKNTTYTFGKLYYGGFYAFYNAPNEDGFVSNPDAVVVRQSANDNYYGYITVGSSDLYFRGSLLTASKNVAFVSSNYGEYKPYGIIPLSDQISRQKCRFGKILIIGDSISAYNYGNYNKWVQALTDEGYFMADINNNSVHATGYVATLSGQQDDTFGVRLKAVTTPSAYDLVVVFGGVNDYLQNVPMGTASDEVTDGFVAAVDDFYGYLAENYLNARLLVILPMKCVTAYNSSGEPVANTAGNQLSDYADYIKQVAEKYSIPTLDLLNESGFYPWVTEFKTAWTHNSDGLHPDANYSAKFLAPLIRRFIDRY